MCLRWISYWIIYLKCVPGYASDLVILATLRRGGTRTVDAATLAADAFPSPETGPNWSQLLPDHRSEIAPRRRAIDPRHEHSVRIRLPGTRRPARRLNLSTCRVLPLEDYTVLTDTCAARELIRAYRRNRSGRKTTPQKCNSPPWGGPKRNFTGWPKNQSVRQGGK